MKIDALSVLIVDDDEFAQDALREMLATLGITRIHTAPNGKQALALLASLPQAPDVLLCDVYMPDMDGIELMNTLAAQNYAGGVVLFSGVDADMLQLAQDIAQAQGLYLLSALTKPVALPELVAALAPLTGA
ncbi:response regulator [Rhodoferax sp.]|uniref:response regulator n=1 Tax=Rhodoferax sp. TaxID=50421 RepID=UPI0026298F76|nr:response regulator [Rhodoferax sp.]MDD5481120.1 response regulator [Rhodoferax sp.]